MEGVGRQLRSPTVPGTVVISAGVPASLDRCVGEDGACPQMRGRATLLCRASLEWPEERGHPSLETHPLPLAWLLSMGMTSLCQVHMSGPCPSPAHHLAALGQGAVPTYSPLQIAGQHMVAEERAQKVVLAAQWPKG